MERNLNNQELIDMLKDIHSEIRDTNDQIIKEVGNLRLILLNLRIQGAHLEGTHGIEPVTIALQSIVDNMEGEIHNLIKKNRENLLKTTEEIEKRMLGDDVNGTM